MTPNLPTNYDAVFTFVVFLIACLTASVPIILGFIFSELKKMRRNLGARR